MKTKAVTSTNIARLGYQDNHLYILFNSGVAYEYAPANEALYLQMSEAESVGQFFHQNIKNKIPHQRLEISPFV